MTEVAQRAGWVRHRTSRSLAASLALLVLLAVPAYPATAQGKLEYGARAAHRSGGSEPATGYHHGIESGVLIVDAVEILNHGNDARSFDVYARDMVASNAGSLTAAPREVDPVGAGGWIDVDTDTLTIDPHESALVAFSVLAPVGTPPGRYVAAILVEPVVEASQTGISSRTRIALPVELEVLGEVDLGVEVGVPRSTRSGGEVLFDVTVTNVGDVSFSADGSLSVDRSFGGSLTAIVELEPADVLIAPGASMTLRGTWEDVPLFGMFETAAMIEATVGSRQPRAFASDTATFWIIPWVLLVTIGAVAAIGITTWNRTRPHRQAWRERHRAERELVRDYRRQNHGGSY